MAEKSYTPITVSDLEEHHKIPEGFLDKQCTDVHIAQVSTKLLDWELVAYHLCLKKEQVEAIDKDGKSIKEKRLKCLMEWKQSQGFRATYRKLLEALVTLEMNDLASRICELCVPQPKEDNKAPFCSERGSCAVHDDLAYFTSFDQVYSYNIYSGEWSTIATCPQWGGSLAVIKGQITYIGGWQTSDYKLTNKLVTLKTKMLTRGKVWVEKYPPMSICRGRTAAVTYNDHLIVIGGTSTGKHKDNLDIVEVLKTRKEPFVWSKAASLPHPLSYASATIVTKVFEDVLCSDSEELHYSSESHCLYVLGGNDANGKCLSVFSCILSEHSCLQIRALPAGAWKWKRVSDLPDNMYYSTCSSYKGHLVAVGGCNTDLEQGESKKTTAVCMYDPDFETWSVVAHMTIARAACFVVPVHEHSISDRGDDKIFMPSLVHVAARRRRKPQLLVIGGHVGKRVEATDDFELVSVDTV